MPDFRPVLLVVGMLLAALGVAMLIPAGVDASAGDSDWQVFVASALVTACTGGGLVLAMRGGSIARLGLREAFLITVLSWTMVGAFAAIPFVFSNLDLNYADAVFEAVSGITTTGSTVITGLDTMHRGILIWRSILQWIGGVGIIVMAIALLPLLQVGGMQLFRTESSDRSEKVMPRLRHVTTAIFALYFGFTLACALLLWATGFTLFEAVNHAMTTLSTGGYSTRDASVGGFHNPLAEIVLIVFMLIGGITFTLYVRAVHGDVKALFRNGQVRWFVSIAALASAAIALWTSLTQGMPFTRALREATFNVVSVVTTTGYVVSDYGLWGSFAVGAFYFLMFVGGCTGSTAGGMKILRFQVIYAIAHQQLMRLLAPHRVTVARVEGKTITDSVAISVLGFFFFYALTFALVSLVLGLLGLDMVTALSSAATAIGNVGPGLGQIVGPSGNFATLPESAKWVLSVGMLLGRLEFVTVFVLLTRAFWRE